MVKRIGRFLTNYLELIGIWPSESPSLAYKLYRVTVLLIFFIFYTAFKCLYLMDLKSVREATFFLLVCLEELSLTVKVLGLLYQHDIAWLNQEFVEQFVATEPSEKQICVQNMRLFLRMAITYCVMTNITALLSFLVPLGATQPELPYLAWYPVDWQHDRHIYWLVYMYQVVGMLIQCNTLVCIEMYFVYLMTVVSTYLEVLAYRLERIADVRNVATTEVLVAVIQCHKYIHRYAFSLTTNNAVT